MAPAPSPQIRGAPVSGVVSSLKRGKGHRRTLDALRLRDGDLCWICDKPMRFDRINGGHAKSASIDHLVPKRLGGDSDKSNLKLAHRSCNTYRDLADLAAKPSEPQASSPGVRP